LVERRQESYHKVILAEALNLINWFKNTNTNPNSRIMK